MLYPLVLGGVSIIASIVGTFFVKAKPGSKIMNALYMGVGVSAVLALIAFVPVTQAFMAGSKYGVWNVYFCAVIGIVLTAAEKQLVGSRPAEKGQSLLKEVRTQLIEAARPVLEAIVLEITGSKVLSLHHDISTVSGEEVVLFTLAAAPLFREAKKK